MVIGFTFLPLVLLLANHFPSASTRKIAHSPLAIIAAAIRHRLIFIVASTSYSIAVTSRALQEQMDRFYGVSCPKRFSHWAPRYISPPPGRRGASNNYTDTDPLPS